MKRFSQMRSYEALVSAQMKREVLVMATRAAALRGELDGLAAENARLLGLTGSPSECQEGAAAANGSRRKDGREGRMEGGREGRKEGERERWCGTGLSGDGESPERRKLTMGALVVSSKREGGENPSPMLMDKEEETASKEKEEETAADLVKARAEISRFSPDLQTIRQKHVRVCVRARGRGMACVCVRRCSRFQTQAGRMRTIFNWKIWQDAARDEPTTSIMRAGGRGRTTSSRHSQEESQSAAECECCLRRHDSPAPQICV